MDLEERSEDRRSRTWYNTLKYIILEKGFLHALRILVRFIWVTVTWENSDVDWIEDGLLGRNTDPKYAVFKTASEVLRWEIVGFFIVFVLRLYLEVQKENAAQHCQPRTTELTEPRQSPSLRTCAK